MYRKIAFAGAEVEWSGARAIYQRAQETIPKELPEVLTVLWTIEAYEEAKYEMGRQLYEGRKPRPYDPTEPTEMDPRGLLDPEYMERLRELDERVMREGIHPYWRILRVLKEWMWRRAWAEAKEEVAKAHPDWVRQWPELFR